MPVRHPVAPRPHTEFLFDDAWIDRRPGTQRVLGVPRKLPQPVFAFEPGRCPWEVPGTLNKHSVLYDAEEGRFVARAESEDFETWTWPRMLLGPGSGDHLQLEFYGMSLTHVGHWRVGCLWVYTNHPEFSPMSTELVYSRDGLAFHRAMPGVDFLPLGAEGAWDSRMHEVLEMIERPGPRVGGGATGPELVLFYNGANFDHGANPPGQRMLEHAVAAGQEPISALGAARLPWGHFCGLRAATFGSVETRWLTNNGGSGVRAVCALEPGGCVKADLLDELGEVVPGWGAAECATRDDGDGWTSFWWDGQNGSNGQVSAAGGMLSHIVKVRFHLRAATLYAFSVGEEEVPADRPSGFTAALRAREGQGGSR